MFSSKRSQENVHLEMDSLNTLHIPSQEECCYTSCYCEENVWKLCEYIKNNQEDLLSTCFAVFISNRNESVPLWCQKSGQQEDNLAVWDYHVIFVHSPENNSGSVVYDLDSTLPFPVPFEKYAPLTFQFDSLLPVSHHRFFRVIPAKIYLEIFASDRSRMKKADGTWIKQPPPYPCLTTNESTNNLEDFISMDSSRGVGEVMNLRKFLERFL
ncbi:protein N-terminal glutamine amidohydrolase-like [Uloborus diversus]|uniref:protein N-terminal glutamine amidohydrolase-like n=1 Tax=Uloborus diversus TaxID=327109 RepID=UPI00240A7707|nr:protein N-terminal glutamine amidohydrolase-like [Uloborus diversus]